MSGWREAREENLINILSLGGITCIFFSVAGILVRALLRFGLFWHAIAAGIGAVLIIIGAVIDKNGKHDPRP